MLILVSCSNPGGVTTLCSVGVELITVCLFSHLLLPGFLLEHLGVLLITNSPSGSSVSQVSKRLLSSTMLNQFLSAHLSSSTTHQLDRHLSSMFVTFL